MALQTTFRHKSTWGLLCANLQCRRFSTLLCLNSTSQKIRKSDDNVIELQSVSSRGVKTTLLTQVQKLKTQFQFNSATILLTLRCAYVWTLKFFNLNKVNELWWTGDAINQVRKKFLKCGEWIDEVDVLPFVKEARLLSSRFIAVSLVFSIGQ